MSNVLERVRKLIALSASSNENEARTAALLACRIIREKGLLLSHAGAPSPIPETPPRPPPPPPPPPPPAPGSPIDDWAINDPFHPGDYIRMDPRAMKNIEEILRAAKRARAAHQKSVPKDPDERAVWDGTFAKQKRDFPPPWHPPSALLPFIGLIGEHRDDRVLGSCPFCGERMFEDDYICVGRANPRSYVHASCAERNGGWRT